MHTGQRKLEFVRPKFAGSSYALTEKGCECLEESGPLFGENFCHIFAIEATEMSFCCVSSLQQPKLPRNTQSSSTSTHLSASLIKTTAAYQPVTRRTLQSAINPSTLQVTQETVTLIKRWLNDRFQRRPL